MQGCSGSALPLALSGSASVLPGSCGPRGWATSTGWSAACTKIALSCRACRKGRGGQDHLQGSAGSGGSTTSMMWRLPGNRRPDRATHCEHGRGRSRRLMGRSWHAMGQGKGMGAWGLRQLPSCMQGITGLGRLCCLKAVFLFLFSRAEIPPPHTSLPADSVKKGWQKTGTLPESIIYLLLARSKAWNGFQ